MRNSLFWRILAVGLLPLIILYIYFNASGSADFIHAHIPFVLLVLGVLAGSAYLVSRNFSQPINHLTQHLDEPQDLTDFFFRAQLLPTEVPAPLQTRSGFP